MTQSANIPRAVLPEVLFRRVIVPETTSGQVLISRLELQLSSADLHPRGLSQQAILCVRHLRDPNPGTLPINQQHSAPAAWQQAVRERLEQMTRQAIRPVLGVVHANTEAVLFDDHAELLACLSMDRSHTDWWWQMLEAALGLQRPLAMIWLDAPECIPAIVQHLESHHLAIQVMGQFTEPEVQALLIALSERFGLTDLHETIHTIFQTQTSISQNLLESVRTVETPWRTWLPPPKATLPIATHLLLAVVTGLTRSANEVRQAKFANAVKRWVQEAQGLPSRAKIKKRVVIDQAKTTNAPENSQTNNSSKPRVRWLEPQQPTPSSHAEILKLDEIVTQSLEQSQARHVHPTKSSTNDLTPQDSTKSAAITNLNARSDKPEDQLEDETESPTPSQTHEEYPEPLESINTQYGGLLFLINVLTALELCSDFTSPLIARHAPKHLGFWHLMAELGRIYLGENLEMDPLSVWLKQRSGASVQNETTPDAWRVPTSWLESFPEIQTCFWSASNGRLWADHPAGFRLFDMPSNTNVQRSLKREIRAYPGLEFERSTQIFQPLQQSEFQHGLSERWLEACAGFVRARLSRALDMPALQVASFVCNQTAHLHDTGTHLEVRFSLERHPIQLRLAGLDRDPGWIPAAGRSIRFVFESNEPFQEFSSQP